MAEIGCQPSWDLHSEGVLKHANRSLLQIEFRDSEYNRANWKDVVVQLGILYFLAIRLCVLMDAVELDPFVTIETYCQYLCFHRFALAYMNCAMDVLACEEVTLIVTDLDLDVV
jgi:hypothetical protein